MRKWIAIASGIGVIASMGFVTWQALCAERPDLLTTGTFVVLSLTLIVLIFYAYDTNTMAKVTQERWMREGVLSTSYSTELLGKKGQTGRTLFRIHNPSTLIVRARVACNFQLYGEPVSAGDLYDGKDTWLVFPQQISQGWFEIESLLQNKGKNVATMIGECNPQNRMEQLTMNLELEFWDELGARRKLPARHHYFDFDRWLWIPHLAERTEAR